MSEYSVVNETSLSVAEIGEPIWPLYWAQEVKHNKTNSKFTFVNGKPVQITEDMRKPKSDDEWLDTLIRATSLLRKLTKITLTIDGYNQVLKRTSQSKSGGSHTFNEGYSVTFSNAVYTLSFKLNISNKVFAGEVIKTRSGMSLTRITENGVE